MSTRAILRAIAIAQPPERRLYRWANGRWGATQGPMTNRYLSGSWIGTSTILEMIRLGLAEVTVRARPGRPIVVRIVEGVAL